MTVRPGMWRDRRGAGIAEYALLLLIVVIIGALVFKFVGGGVKHAGSKTNEQFAAGGGAGESANGPGAGGGSSAGEKSKAGDKTAGQGREGTSQGSGQGAGAAAGAGGGGGATAQASQNGQGGGSSAEDEQPGGERSTPLWKILGGVFVLLFAAGGYFAFRKQKSSG